MLNNSIEKHRYSVWWIGEVDRDMGGTEKIKYSGGPKLSS